MGLKKPHRQCMEFGNIKKWFILTAGMKIASLQSKVVLYGEIGKDLCPNLFQTFVENINWGSIGVCVPPPIDIDRLRKKGEHFGVKQQELLEYKEEQ